MNDHERRLHGLLRFCESAHVSDRAEAARDAAALRWALAELDRLRGAVLRLRELEADEARRRRQLLGDDS